MQTIKHKLLRTFITALLAVLSMVCQAQDRPKIGLVLGGGGAKGAAEVGALKVIEDLGIPIDYICGTSIGSIIGGLYSVGYRSADMEEMLYAQQWTSLLTDRNDSLKHKVFAHDRDGVFYVLGFPVKRRHTVEADTLQGLFKGKKIQALFRKTIDDSPVARGDSGVRRIPFKCVATDVAHGKLREVVLSADSASLDSCMRASMAIPGLFKPTRIGKNILIDGGTTNNLPVDVVREMGADIVIAIDLQQNKHDDYKSPLSFLRGNSAIAEWLKERPDIKKYNEMRKSADIYINPDLSGYDMMSFNSEAIKDMVARGEKAAKKQRHDLKKALKAIKKALKKKK